MSFKINKIHNGCSYFTATLGNIGIGTTVPTHKLDVQNGNARINNVFLGDVGHGSTWAGFSHSSSIGTDRYGLLQSSDGLYTLINKKSGGGYIGFRVNNVDRMVINDVGNVGIGTINPTEKLDVVGAIKSKGNLVARCNSGTVQLDKWGDSDWIDPGFGNVPFFVYAEDIYIDIPGVPSSARGFKIAGEENWPLSYYFIQIENGRFKIYTYNFGLENKEVRWWAFTIY